MNAETYETDAAYAPVRPPLGYLVAAALCVLTSAGLLFVAAFYVNVLGYVLASLLAVLIVGVFRQHDQRLRNDPRYSPRHGIAGMATTVVVAGIGVAMVHAWFIATELSKQ